MAEPAKARRWPVLSAACQRIVAWWKSPQRRQRNATGTMMDRVYLLLLSSLMLPSVLLRIWLVEDHLGVAMRGVPYLFFILLLPHVVIKYHSSFYMAHREVITTLTLLLGMFTLRDIAANGPGNLFISHGGSMARLAMLLMMTGHAVWCFIHSLYHRWSPNWSRLALPLTALLPLLVGESVCHKLLAAPGTLQPLEQLHTAMVVAHGLMLPPGALLVGLETEQDNSLQQCLALDGYLLVFFGILLPSFLLGCWERREWQALAGEERAGQQLTERELSAHWMPERAAGATFWELYAYSCFAWHSMHGLQLLGWMGGTAG